MRLMASLHNYLSQTYGMLHSLISNDEYFGVEDWKRWKFYIIDKCSEFIVNPIHFGTRINQMHRCFNEKHTDRSDAIWVM